MSYWVRPNSYPEWWNFQFAPKSIYTETISFLPILYKTTIRFGFNRPHWRLDRWWNVEGRSKYSQKCHPSPPVRWRFFDMVSHAEIPVQYAKRCSIWNGHTIYPTVQVLSESRKVGAFNRSRWKPSWPLAQIIRRLGLTRKSVYPLINRR